MKNSISQFFSIATVFAFLIAAVFQHPAHSINRTVLTPLSVQPRPAFLVNKKTIVTKRVASTQKRSGSSLTNARLLAKSAKKFAKRGGSKTVLAKALRVKKNAIPKMSKEQRITILRQFKDGTASKITPAQLVAAGAFSAYPLRGGSFKRKNMPQNLVIHSTETGSIADAKAIIRSWNNGGSMHPGTQYIVDRDGTIYQTVDPVRATYHVNSFKTLLGVKNENSIGIETVRTGSQTYTDKQMKSLICLSHYLKDHFALTQVVGHGQIQPSDRSDPVLFDWTAFNQGLNLLDASQIALKKSSNSKS